MAKNLVQKIENIEAERKRRVTSIVSGAVIGGVAGAFIFRYLGHLMGSSIAEDTFASYPQEAQSTVNFFTSLGTYAGVVTGAIAGGIQGEIIDMIKRYKEHPPIMPKSVPYCSTPLQPKEISTSNSTGDDESEDDGRTPPSYYQIRRGF
jgi:hypothetical protein